MSLIECKVQQVPSEVMTMMYEDNKSIITGRSAEGKRICLLDLNYTLVRNQMETRLLKPLSKRLEYEEYRADLIDVIKDDYVIIITARPNYQQDESIENIKRKTKWIPDEWYFNDINAEPPAFKERALNTWVFPSHGTEGSKYYAVESNPKTREMYSTYGICANPYDVFMKM